MDEVELKRQLERVQPTARWAMAWGRDRDDARSCRRVISLCRGRAHMTVGRPFGPGSSA